MDMNVAKHSPVIDPDVFEMEDTRRQTMSLQLRMTDSEMVGDKQQGEYYWSRKKGLNHVISSPRSHPIKYCISPPLLLDRPQALHKGLIRLVPRKYHYSETYVPFELWYFSLQ